jgi:hypothetical protein
MQLGTVVTLPKKKICRVTLRMNESFNPKHESAMAA